MKSCRVCKEKHHAKGLCEFHYKRQWKGTPLTQPRRILDGKQGCYVDNCDREHSSKGLCSLHYDRLKRGSPFDDVDYRGETYRRKHEMAQLPDDIREAYGA